MKKIIVSILATMVWGAGFCQTAQTGINTTTPQQTLHVSGTSSSAAQADGTTGKFLVTPTMRVDGLGKTNNPTPYTGLGTKATLPLYATTDGELVIGNNRVNTVLQSLPNTVPVDAIVVNGYINVTTSPTPPTKIKELSFDLSRTSMVYINATVAIGSVGSPASPNPAVDPTVTPITDNIARMMGIQLQFSEVGAGSGVPISVPFASTTDSYTNGGTGVPTGYFWYTLGKEIRLTPGHYTLQIYATGAGNGNAFKYFAGGGTNVLPALGTVEALDQVNIIAIAL